jgi:hypothetical protein
LIHDREAKTRTPTRHEGSGLFGEGVQAGPFVSGSIEEAVWVMDPVFLDCQQYEAEALGEELRLRLVCRAETANPIRSMSG